VIEHLLTTSVLLYQVLCLLLNNLCLDHSQKLRLSLLLEEVVCSLFLLKNVLLCLSKILWTVKLTQPCLAFLVIFFLRSINEEFLELTLIDREVLFTLPHIVIILLDDIGSNEAHLDEGLNALLQQVKVNLLSISVTGNLIKQSHSQLLTYLVEALVLEVYQSTCCQ
jgi:hypothetical protein